MFLTPDDAAAILRQAGARRVAILDKLFALFAFFEHRGVAQVWRIRKAAHVSNFERDVARELGANSETERVH
jgi:hypothetical protein